MTKFSFEVPLKHLDDFADLQDYLFALSFLVEDERYLGHLQREHSHKLLTLDNSFNELGRAQEAKEMWELARKLNAEYVVSPDSDSWTPEEMMNAYKMMKNVGFPPEQIILPIRSMKEFEVAKSQGVYSFAIPYEYRSFFPEAFPWTKVHFLGLRDPLEIKMCRPLSCDTSMPIKLAMRGVSLRTWMLTCCPHEQSTPHFFTREMTLKQIDLARKNIQELKEMCRE